ncbi:aminotransferase-like domain-containing protein [Brochothrix thermosphacta]|uniref:aminotransferase-like domain-containing protein n=1 Tax=Brochothrix thermosphacta TaxID=2756 RepID=UPI000EA2978B
MYKYQQLSEALRQALQANKWPVGTKIPSIRSLSEAYKQHRGTVIQALQQLEKEHLLYVVPRSGYYVVKKEQLPITMTNPAIHFESGGPDWHYFPYKDFQHCLNQAITTYQEALFMYGTPNGLPDLLRMAQKQLATQQVFTKTANIFVTSGVQQALDILCQMPFPNNKKTILIEEPGYHAMIQLLKLKHIPFKTIARTTAGIDFNALEKLFKTNDIKFFYTMPRFHNPLGTSYNTAEKQRLVALAIKYNVYLVEDDYLQAFETDAKADPLYSYDLADHVIYLKSFSKIIFPGLRIGWCVIPELLITTFKAYKALADIDSSMLSQAAFAIYIQNGMYARHQKQLQAIYIRRSKVLIAALKEKDTEGYLQIFETKAMKTHLLLPDEVPVNYLYKKLLQQNIHLMNLENNYITTSPPRNLLCLDVTNVSETEIEKGITILTQTVNALFNERKH